MKLALLLAFSWSVCPLLADTSAAYPPNPYETQGGMRAPTFSDANAAAIHFISIVDNQVWGGAWIEAGKLMQDIVPREIWVDGIRALRMKLGVVRARKVVSHQLIHVLPGGTQGEFMVIKYQTQFAQQPNTVEVVILMMQPPLGLWRVICYSIEQ